MKKRAITKKRVRVILISVLIAAILCAVVFWYFEPFERELPENPAIKIRVDDIDFWVENQEDVSNIKRILDGAIFQRESEPNNGIFPANIRVRTGEFFIMEIYDADELIAHLPKHIGDFVFIIPSPEASRFVIRSRNNRKKDRIFNAESILGEMTLVLEEAFPDVFVPFLSSIDEISIKYK